MFEKRLDGHCKHNKNTKPRSDHLKIAGNLKAC